MKKSKKGIILIRVIVALVVPQTATAGIVGSKHDLSSTNPYGATGYETTEICVFCHTPHGANIDLNNDGARDDVGTGAQAPLWNRRLSTVGSVFTPYLSPTLDSSCLATPSPVSLACLSCHDSATAGGSVGVVNKYDAHDLVNTSNKSQSGVPYHSANDKETKPNCNACHNRGDNSDITSPQHWVPGVWWQVGPDLSDDHPISMLYADAYTADHHFNSAGDVEAQGLRFYEGRVECPSCHDPHNPAKEPFLRKTVDGSALCLVCHNK